MLYINLNDFPAVEVGFPNFAKLIKQLYRAHKHPWGHVIYNKKLDP